MNFSIPTGAALAAPAPQAAAWTREDDLAATAEGWAFFDAEGELQLQRIDSPDDKPEPVFASDDAAWLHVWQSALDGSAFHRRALAYLKGVSPQEYERVEAYGIGVPFGKVQRARAPQPAPILKTIVTLTILHRASDKHPSQLSQQDLLYEVDEGCYLGSFQIGETVRVPADRVEDECKALGNDGSFFDDEELG